MQLELNELFSRHGKRGELYMAAGQINWIVIQILN
jgi:hypothetical protein